MPELPEVEIVVRGVRELVVGKRIVAISHDWNKAFPNTAADVETFAYDATFTDVARRGKAIIMGLSTGYSFVVHLKMTGQLVFVDPQDTRFGAGHPNDSLIAALPDSSTRVTFEFFDGSFLYFNDQRKFGWVKLLPTAEVGSMPFFQKLGPEPLEKSFTGEVLFQRLQRRKNTTIKAALLDQTVLAGVGNIYADESLWAAKIHPETRVVQLQPDEVGRLYAELVAVLQLSIEKGGSTDRTYVNAEGKKGSYISFARVFRRENEPCGRCGDTIIKMRVAGRGTHVCPTCQKEKK